MTNGSKHPVPSRFAGEKTSDPIYKKKTSKPFNSTASKYLTCRHAENPLRVSPAPQPFCAGPCDRPTHDPIESLKKPLTLRAPKWPGFDPKENPVTCAKVHPRADWTMCIPDPQNPANTRLFTPTPSRASWEPFRLRHYPI